MQNKLFDITLVSVTSATSHTKARFRVMHDRW